MMNPTANPSMFSFRMPGQPTAAQVQRPLTYTAHTKRLGIVPMAPDSSHQITIAGRPVYVTCRDRRAYPRAKGFACCLHPACAGKAWGSERELREAHAPQPELEARNEIHLVGFWSDDDCGPPVDSCKACEAATAKASGEATKALRAKDPKAAEVVILRACDEHGGGALGLLTVTDPNAGTA